ncbi:hypothetical protein GF361_04930 [Candidatus Woesearchaeota archaeon]|nr:hypothetical protein [Candidatus Woesearchaeota archaeon]
MKEEIKELKKLSPKERIKKLKELQEKDKEEIKQAHELLKQAEDESEIEDELREIPIPQLKAVEIGELFSPEEKELFKTKRFSSGKKKKETKEKETKERPSAMENIAETAPKLSPEEEQQHIEYLQELSKKPTETLYNETKNIYSNFKDKGYISPEEQEKLNDIEYANKSTFQAIQTGEYPEGQITKDVAREMVLIEKMKHAMYKR